MNKLEKVNFIVDDINNKELTSKVQKFFNKKIDVVLSDMAANTSGNKALDSFRTGELCLNAMDLSTKILSHNGTFLSKVFMGSIFKEIDVKAKKNFKKVVKYKPLSSKKESKEIYIYCKGVLNI
jgi:23S rRNA U2552 (ribose-2'-O)-methylase RlmE/FtsJ